NAFNSKPLSSSLARQRQFQLKHDEREESLMCGIVGVVSNKPIEQKIIEKMRDRLVHRGPDHAGIWLSDDKCVCLGHRRLAIIDLSPEANQPFISHDGRYIITFNGEIYNFKELRGELLKNNVPFHTQSDTEVLVEAFRYWGKSCLERLSGMFAFAIWDKVERRLFCARDRVGEKPFYYTVVDGSFIFASELKALLPWPGFRRRIDYPAILDFLTFGFVVDPKSIWENCFKLPPGHWMSVETNSDGRPTVKKPVAYWDMEFHLVDSSEDWEPQILDVLQSASTEMAFADVPVGAFLSGGVDSSSVTAALSKADCLVNTFTVGFDEQDYDERPWAREVSQLYNTPHSEKVVVAGDVLPVFDKLLWHFDEPFNDYSYLPTFYLCREARKDITVALSGDGGDEMFAGYRKYQRLSMRQQVGPLISQPLRLMAAGVNMFLPGDGSFRRKVAHYGSDEAAMLADMMFLGFQPAQIASLARGALAESMKHYTPLDAIRPLLAKAPPEEVGLINSMRYLDLKLTLAGDILVKIDRASMAVSLEVRPVYLHRDMIALAARIPAHLLVDGNNSKKILKSALTSWLPNSLLHRKKQGFAMPLNRWVNGELGQAFLSNGKSNLDDILDSTLLQKFSSGKSDGSSGIHSLFFLKHWFDKWT
ncbi:MAG: asparagine synthase (glutamine-hydrolyzing), partial [Calditrichaeota bacterium]|nr:asparagine synthase (glutamine-hydrolyzing) [Calditrichota bacterium]